MARTTRSAAKHANTSFVKGPQQLSSPPSTPAASDQENAKRPKTTPRIRKTQVEKQPATPRSSRKRSRTAVKQEETDSNELPHNLGSTFSTSLANKARDEDEEPSQKRTKPSAKRENLDEVSPDVKSEDPEHTADIKPTPRKGKKANYGLTPGISPFPDYARPTPDECYEVTRLLEKTHGKKSAPKVIPQGSMTVAGCGEVPRVVDALVRTRLSAATTGRNSSAAMEGLFRVFGYQDKEIDKDCVDWDAVRTAPQKKVFEAIKCGGLAQVKSRDIQTMLQMVWEENQERKAAHLDPSNQPAGAENEGENEKQQEISKASKNIISLDHVHLLSTQDAINKFLTYPGIGPKTASCVALFCLQRPSFAVDTHVFRLCQYLGWVPKTTKKGQPKVNRETTYSHCDVRVPDELKYPLHQLFLEHGKKCPRCRAATGQNSANWAEGCVIEHLVKRHGSKKGGISVADRKQAQAAAGLSDDDVEDDMEDAGEEAEADADEDEDEGDE